MNLHFKHWLGFDEATALMGTTGTDPGEPTPTGAAPSKKVTYPGNAGSAGGEGKVDAPKAAGCSGGPCPPKTQSSPRTMGSGGGGGAAPAVTQAPAATAGPAK